MDSESCPRLGRRPEAEAAAAAAAADSEMTDLVPEDGQKKADAPISADGRRDSPSASVDLDGAADGSAAVVRGKFPEPYSLLRRVLREELGGGGGGEHRLLVAAAVHAVMQESGFVAVDPATGMPADRWPPSTAFAASVWYSLPEIVARKKGLNMSERVLLKFQGLGHFITVYGILAKAKLGLRRVCLDERRFAPAIDLIRAKGDGDDDDEAEANEDGGSSTSYPLKEVFEFWMLVKDGLALPLLIDLAERAGFPVPSCFAHLPAELKLKILESLPGIGIARVGCACSELRDLTSSDDLWKQKYVEEFGGRTAKGGGGMFNWKQRFARSWTAKKKRRRRAIRHLRHWTGIPLSGFEGVSVPCCLRNYRRRL